MDGRDVRVRVELTAEPRSVREARRVVVGVLRDWHLPHLEDTAVLLVSELATNAVLHARTAFAVEAERRGEVVRVGLSDGSDVGPARRRHGVQAGTGRGLGLVAALSTDWGTDDATDPWRKTVWFELPVDPALLPEPAEDALLA